MFVFVQRRLLNPLLKPEIDIPSVDQAPTYQASHLGADPARRGGQPIYPE